MIPNHKHTSDETDIWLKGDFIYINGEDGRAAELSGQVLISSCCRTCPAFEIRRKTWD